MAVRFGVRLAHLKTVAWVGVSLLSFVLVEALLFRSGWYDRFLEPNSSAGNVESHLYWMRQYSPSHAGEVLVVGDSRVAEGFSQKIANQDTLVNGREYFWNGGLAGTTPRVWYYFLRDADPSRQRFRAIVIGLDHYSDQDSYDPLADRLIDLNFVVSRLGIVDVWPFASSMNDPAKVRLALSQGLLKGTVFRRDVQVFLENIPDRLKNIKILRTEGFRLQYEYGGKQEDLDGLTLDRSSHELYFPARLTGSQRQSIKVTVTPGLPAQNGEMTRYRKLWLGRILELYRYSGTRIFFVELPRAPLHPVYSDAPMDFVEWAGQQTRVTVVDKETFRDLEQPIYFGDGLHLNHLGRGEFSVRMARILAASLGGSH